MCVYRYIYRYIYIHTYKGASASKTHLVRRHRRAGVDASACVKVAVGGHHHLCRQARRALERVDVLSEAAAEEPLRKTRGPVSKDQQVTRAHTRQQTKPHSHEHRASNGTTTLNSRKGEVGASLKQEVRLFIYLSIDRSIDPFLSLFLSLSRSVLNCICTCIYIHIYMYVCMYVYIYIHICMYICMYIYVCIYINIYVCIHT